MALVVVIRTVVEDGNYYSYDCFDLYLVGLLVRQIVKILVETEVALLVVDALLVKRMVVYFVYKL